MTLWMNTTISSTKHWTQTTARMLCSRISWSVTAASNLLELVIQFSQQGMHREILILQDLAQSMETIGCIFRGCPVTQLIQARVKPKKLSSKWKSGQNLGNTTEKTWMSRISRPILRKMAIGPVKSLYRLVNQISSRRRRENSKSLTKRLEKRISRVTKFVLQSTILQISSLWIFLSNFSNHFISTF